MEKHNILDNVKERGEQIKSLLSGVPGIDNLRSIGLIIGFDLKDQETRDRFMQVSRDAGMICNSTGLKSIRLRPNLAITSEDAKIGCDIIKKAISEV